MPSFGITPASGYPPATDQGFPRFIQWQVDGADIGSRAIVETVNVIGGAEGSVNSGGDTVTLDLRAVGGDLTWREVPGDYTLVAADANNGIAATGVSGAQTITIPGEDVEIAVGKSVLVYAEGGGGVQFVPVSGVTLRYRDAFLAQIAGQFGIVTLIKRAADEWLLCGDMAAA